jgi:hypothetical protein
MAETIHLYCRRSLGHPDNILANRLNVHFCSITTYRRCIPWHDVTPTLYKVKLRSVCEECSKNVLCQYKVRSDDFKCEVKRGTLTIALSTSEVQDVLSELRRVTNAWSDNVSCSSLHHEILYSSCALVKAGDMDRGVVCDGDFASDLRDPWISLDVSVSMVVRGRPHVRSIQSVDFSVRSMSPLILGARSTNSQDYVKVLGRGKTAKSVAVWTMRVSCETDRPNDIDHYTTL